MRWGAWIGFSHFSGICDSRVWRRRISLRTCSSLGGDMEDDCVLSVSGAILTSCLGPHNHYLHELVHQLELCTSFRAFGSGS